MEHTTGEFIGEEIQVRLARPGVPTSFTWGRREVAISQIVGMRRALDFRKPWWRRRHRDDYVVKTDRDETFRIYFHRGPGRKYWVLYARLEG